MKLLSKQTFLLIAFGLPALLSIGYLASKAFNFFPTTSQTFTGKEIPNDILQKFESLTGVKFPPSTSPVGFHFEKSLDGMAMLKVELNRSELLDFRTSIPVSEDKLSKVHRSCTNLKGFDWWNPEDAKSFESGQADLPNARYMNLLMNWDDEKIVTVFLEWLET